MFSPPFGMFSSFQLEVPCFFHECRFVWTVLLKSCVSGFRNAVLAVQWHEPLPKEAQGP